MIHLHHHHQLIRFIIIRGPNPFALPSPSKHYQHAAAAGLCLACLASSPAPTPRPYQIIKSLSLSSAFSMGGSQSWWNA
jgi:hypothetical protein